MVVGLCFAARGVEVYSFDWCKIRRDISLTDSSIRFIIKFIRSKSAGPPLEEEAYLTGKNEVRILDFWFSIFPTPRRIGRFFQYLSDKGLPQNNKPIGKNSLAKTAYKIALRIGYSEAEASKKMGHWTRANALTLGAEAGLDGAALQRLSGHKSLNVCNSYISRTDRAKTDQANILSMDNPESSPARASKKTRRSPGRSPGFFDADKSAGGGSHSTFSGPTVVFQNCDFSTATGVLSGFFGQAEAKKVVAVEGGSAAAQAEDCKDV